MTPVLIALAVLAGCAPKVRAYAWYQAHPDVATQVAAACGPSRTEDCANAAKAAAHAASDRRLDAYRKAF